MKSPESAEGGPMELQEMIRSVKARPDYPRVGMIACHNGVVRATSTDGRRVKGLYSSSDREALERILGEMRARPGIVEVAVHIFDGYRRVGEDVMLVVVAGDIRSHVFPVLEETVERLKNEVSKKEEHFLE
jgi:molybdopterin synthase catalytic subunit